MFNMFLVDMEHSAGAIIRKEDKFLVIQSLGGLWGFPKGHLEEGETIEQAALREVKEETNLTINLLKKSDFISYELKNGLKRVDIFVADWVSGMVELQETELSSFKWLTKEEVLNTLSFNDMKELFLNLI